MKRRRTILKVLCLLAAGAAINVAVAWGCVQWSPRRGSEAGPSDTINRLIVVRDSSLDNWTFGDVRTGFVAGFGLRQLYNLYYVTNADVRMRYQVSLDVKAGWPASAMYGSADFHRWPNEHWSRNGTIANPPAAGQSHWSGEWRDFPTYPLWPGFAINTVFYAGLLWMLFAGPFAWRRMIRRRRGRCAHCAYPIGPSPVCTECGVPRPHATAGSHVAA